MRIVLICLCLASLAHPAELSVGAASVVLTPPEGTPLAGYYGYRGTKSVLDDIHAKAIVLEVGDAKAALVVCDLISLPRHVVTEAHRQIEKATGIPGANVMISATHTHTGPVLNRESSLDELVGRLRTLGEGTRNGYPNSSARAWPRHTRNSLQCEPRRPMGRKRASVSTVAFT